MTQGTVIMYFVCSSQRGGDKRAADYRPSQTELPLHGEGGVRGVWGESRLFLDLLCV